MPFDGLGFVRPQSPRLLPAAPFETDLSHPRLAGVVGLWPLAGDTLDYSQNGAHGSPNNPLPAVIGQFGPCYSFNGTSQYVDATSPCNGPSVTNQITIAAWVRSASAIFERILQNMTSGSSEGSGYDLFLRSNGAISFLTGNGSATELRAGSGYQDGKWHRIVATKNASGGAVVYVDGKSVATSSTMPPIGSSTVNLRIGNTTSGTPQYFNGNIAGVIILARPWTAAEVAADYAEPFAMLRPRVRRTWVGVGASPTAITLAQATLLWRPAALTTNAKTQTTLAQAPLRWFPRALAVNAKTQATISRQSWAWTPRSAGVNQTTQITPPTRAWKWSVSPAAINQRTQTTVTQSAWRWAARALEITQPTLLTFARVAWFWRGRKLPGYGSAALSQVQGLVFGFVRKFVSGFDETPPE